MPRTYKLHHGKATVTYDAGCDGACIMPDSLTGDTSGNIDIWIYHKLRGRKKLDTLIHEVLHAEHPGMSEADVLRTATNIMTVLWGEGYRNKHEGKP
jgi:hypothetical protein